MSRTTVLGYDGSPAAKAVLSLAARRAGDEGAVLAVHVITAPSDFVETPYYERALEHARTRGEALLEELEREAQPNVRSELVTDGPPARALVDMARNVGADEIAAGSRGFTPLRAAVLGSTAHALLHEADRPVLLLTRAALGDHARERGTAVVVGFDGSDNARAALGYAKARAAESGGPLIAVSAYDAPSDWLGTPYYQRALDEHRERHGQLLGELDQQGGDGSLETDLVQGPPADALARVADSRRAAEIVVGTRGFGRFRGALGSVSHALLHEASCPVVVVPGPAPATT